MADIQLIQCKNQQKSSLNRPKVVLYKEIGVTESIADFFADVRIFTGNS